MVGKSACGMCNKLKSDSNCDENKDNWLKCNSCSLWHHTLCCAIDSNEHLEKCEKLKKWFCPICIKDSNFSHLTSKVLSSINTTQGLSQTNLKDKDFINHLVEE